MIAPLAAASAVALSTVLVSVFPRSILAFLAFQASLLYVYVSGIPGWLRASLRCWC